MLFFWMLVAALVIGLVRGGKLSRLGDLSLRHFWLVFVAFGIQLALHTHALADVPLIVSVAPFLYPVAYFVLLYCFTLNRKVQGVWGLAAGTASNMLAIIANGGKMPVDGDALVALGHGPVRDAFASGHSLTHTIITDQTRLPWLGDVFCGTPPFPNPTIFSLGDVLLGIGVFFLVQGCMLGKDASAANRPTTS